MSSVFGKLREFVGIPDPEEYEEYGEYDEIQGEGYSDMYEPAPAQALPAPEVHTSQPEPEPSSTMTANMNTSNMNNVVGMPGANRFWGSAAEVLVMEPRAFEEMPQVIQALREQKSVVLNLTMMDPAQAQRAVDFVAGATYTIDGHQERVGDSIFLFTPRSVQVSTQSGVVHEVTQPQVSRPPANPWKTTEPAFSQIAQ